MSDHDATHDWREVRFREDETSRRSTSLRERNTFEYVHPEDFEEVDPRWRELLSASAQEIVDGESPTTVNPSSASHDCGMDAEGDDAETTAPVGKGAVISRSSEKGDVPESDSNSKIHDGLESIVLCFKDSKLLNIDIKLEAVVELYAKTSASSTFNGMSKEAWSEDLDHTLKLLLGDGSWDERISPKKVFPFVQELSEPLRKKLEGESTRITRAAVSVAPQYSVFRA